jgi:hypothetical protein
MTDTPSADYLLVDHFYLQPTPAGVFHAVSDNSKDRQRNFLLQLLKYPVTPRADDEQLCLWYETSDTQEALSLLYEAQSFSWVQGFATPQELTTEGIGRALPRLLFNLSSVHKALIVDANGIALANCGLNEETAETLAALTADIAAVQARHSKRLAHSLGIATQGWGAIDAFGSSRIGLWPLYIGQQRLMLVLLGEPRLHHGDFVTLIWLLVSRYG